MGMNEYFYDALRRGSVHTGAGIPVSDTAEQDFEPFFQWPMSIRIVEEDKGFIFGIVYPVFYNTSVLVAQELGFWVEEEYRGTPVGVRLLKQFEEQCKARGATRIYVASLNGFEADKSGRMYSKMGYHPIEQVYIKEIA